MCATGSSKAIRQNCLKLFGRKGSEQDPQGQFNLTLEEKSLSFAGQICSISSLCVRTLIC